MMSLSFRPALSLLAASGLAFLTVCGAGAQQAQFSTVHRNAERTLPQRVTGGSAKLRTQLASGRAATSLIVTDFDEDGTGDLVSGYAVGSGGALLLQRGNSHAIAPTQAELRLAATGQPVQPFAAKSEAISLPIHPDLLQTADIGGHGHSDVLVAAKGDSNIYLLRGDGKGNFGSPEALSLSGAVSALATWRGPEGANLIAAGVCGATGCGVELLGSDGKAKAFVSTNGVVTGMEVAHLNYGKNADLAVITASNVVVFDGATLTTGSPRSAALPVSGAAAVATGLFTYDRRAFGQIAVLGSDATLHVFTRAGVDNTTPTLQQIHAARNALRSGKPLPAVGPSAASLAWTEAETIYNVGPGGSSAVMLRGRFSGGGYDDLAVMAGGQYVTVAHPITSDGTLRTTRPVVTVDSTSSSVTSAVVTRLSPDARLSVITANNGLQPNFTIPGSSRTMNVNTTADAVVTTAAKNACKGNTVGCTLRAAIAVVNDDSASNGQGHVDTINLPAGTYTITANNGSSVDAFGSFNSHFDIDGSANLVGAGAGSTIINAAQVDKVLSVNSGVVNGFAPFDVFFSNMTIENGDNKNNPNSAQCGGTCDFFGGNMDFDSAGPGTLGFSNVVLTGGKIDFGDGGGLLASNVTTGATVASGLTEFDNSTISNNSAPEAGGGLETSDLVPVTLSSVTVSGNTASPSVNTGDPGKTGEGGGLYIEADPNGTSATAVSIVNSTFSNNTAFNSGGAIETFGTSPTISGSTFTSNTAGVYGGALYLFNDGTNATTITTSTFTGNSATNNQPGAHTGDKYTSNGGAICLETNSSTLKPVLTINFSRFHGNTSSATGSATGLGVGCQTSAATSGFATVNATDNWWGCNGAGTGTGCDSAINGFPTTAVLTTTPFTNLILNLTSTTPAAGSSFTATGSLGQDSNGTAYSQANDLAYDGVSATLTITQNGGGITNSSATTLTSTAAPSTSFAAIATTATSTAAGSGTAAVTVDGFTVSKGFTVVATETKLVYTSAPAPSISAGGNAGTVKVAIEDGSNNLATGDSTTVVTLTVTGPSYLQTYTATAASGVATFNLTGVALNTAGAYVYTASATNLTSAVANETVGAASQTITFTGLPATDNFGSAGPYTLNGTASSGLPVSYTVSGPATLSGTTLTITGVGTVSVTASQAGNANFNAATPVTQTIIVSPGNQTITFTGLPATATFGSAGPYTLNGTASSGLPVSYTVSGPATLSGTTLTITGVGTVSVTASQAGNANFNAATPVTRTIIVSPGNQTITFTGLPATANFGSAGPYTLNGTASSGLPVSYTVSGPATLSGTMLTITGPGTVSVTASQAGNGNFNAATPVTQAIVVGKASQTISFTGLPANATFGLAGPYTLNGTASSGLPVSYSVSGPASLSGTTLTITGTGVVAVTASQAGDANFNAATPVTQTINVVANNGTVQLNTTAVLTKLSGGGYMAVITVTNVGTGVAQNVDLTGATLGSATGTPLPALLGTLAPSGGSASATVTFSASAGSSGTLTVERFTGTYTGGTFGGSFRVTLP